MERNKKNLCWLNADRQQIKRGGIKNLTFKAILTCTSQTKSDNTLTSLKGKCRSHTFLGGGGGFLFCPSFSSRFSLKLFFVSVSDSTTKKWWHFSHLTKRVEAGKEGDGATIRDEDQRRDLIKSLKENESEFKQIHASQEHCMGMCKASWKQLQDMCLFTMMCDKSIKPPEKLCLFAIGFLFEQNVTLGGKTRYKQDTHCAAAACNNFSTDLQTCAPQVPTKMPFHNVLARYLDELNNHP